VSGRPARLAAAALAVIVLAGLGWRERAVRLQQHALDEAGAGHVDTAVRDLERAARLNPDSTPDVFRALLLFKVGGRRPSIAILRSVVEREPDNLQAWGYLANYAAGRDPATRREALAAVRRLDPLDARRSRRGG
jgi:predicted Zn-dependent protease